MSEHTSTPMVIGQRYPKKSRPHGRFRHGTNVWFTPFQCPTCGNKTRLLSNAICGARISCDGKTHVVRKP